MKGSDNPYPSLLFEEHVDPANPAAGHHRMFVDTDQALKMVDSAGTVTVLGAASGAVGTDAIWDAAGDLAVGTGANTAAKLTKGADGTILTMAGGAVGWAAPAAGASILLAYKAHTAGDETTGGTSLADVDATNAAVTFTAPASSNVLVRLSASAGSSVTASAYMSWGLREGSSDIAGAVGESIADRTPATAAQAPYRALSMVFVLVGISAGSHTYKWSHACSSGTGNMKANANSPAVMEVWALP